MADITIQGMDSINDFWCYLNGDRAKSYIASGDGVNQAKIPWQSPDFVEVNVRYLLQDYFPWKIGYDQYKDNRSVFRASRIAACKRINSSVEFGVCPQNSRRH